MLDQIAERHDCPLIMVAHRDLLAFRICILLIRHEDRHLRTNLGELEGAYGGDSDQPYIPRTRPFLCNWISGGNPHAIKVIQEPAVAPAAPKQAIVPSVGYAPFLLTCSRGRNPKCWPIQSEYVYFERWYIENETVRTRVTLARGAVTPTDRLNQQVIRPLQAGEVKCMQYRFAVWRGSIPRKNPRTPSE